MKVLGKTKRGLGADVSEHSTLYTLTFLGLYLELIGAFLLSAEAIGSENLLRLAKVMRSRRILGFAVLVILVIAMVVLARMQIVLHLTEAIVLVVSLGLFFDFGPALIEIIVKRLSRGYAGFIGFLLFSIGFVLQAYVSLSVLF